MDGKIFAINRARMESAHATRTSHLSQEISTLKEENATLRRALSHQPAKAKTRGDTDPLDSMSRTERSTVAAWMQERVEEMKSDRAYIREEYGCDLVALLDALAKSIRPSTKEKKK